MDKVALEPQGTAGRTARSRADDQRQEPIVTDEPAGIPATDLSDDDLLRELQQLHDTRNDTLRHGSDDALAQHGRRTRELEGEYLNRFPAREVDPERIRAGARQR